MNVRNQYFLLPELTQSYRMCIKLALWCLSQSLSEGGLSRTSVGIQHVLLSWQFLIADSLVIILVHVVSLSKHLRRPTLRSHSSLCPTTAERMWMTWSHGHWLIWKSLAARHCWSSLAPVNHIFINENHRLNKNEYYWFSCTKKTKISIPLTRITCRSIIE